MKLIQYLIKSNYTSLCKLKYKITLKDLINFITKTTFD
jgi:hypothetical protein